MIQILDTNVILRFFVGDNKDQQEKSKLIFSEAEKGKRKLLVKPLIIAECCFVLESFYKKERDQIASSFEVFLSQKWLMVEDREVLLLMWNWYRKNLHFVDSYLLAWAKTNKSKIVSFDKKLLRSFK